MRSWTGIPRRGSRRSSGLTLQEPQQQQHQQQQQPQQQTQASSGATLKVKTRRRANSVAFACRTDYGLPDDSDDNSLPKNPVLLVAEPERRRSAIDTTEGFKERSSVFTLS